MLLRILLGIWLLSGLLTPTLPIATSTTPTTASPEFVFSPLNYPYGAVIALAQHPEHPEELWAIAAAASSTRPITALYRSRDGGATWQPAGNDLSWLRLTALAISPDGTRFLGTSNGLYRQSATDQTWHRVPLETAQGDSEPFVWPAQGMTVRQILLPDADPNRIYVIAAENHKYPRHWLFRSLDGGQRFERFLIQEFSTDPGSGLGRVLVDPTDPDRLYAATRGGVLLSTDGGTTWRPGGLDPSLTEGMTVLAVSAGQPNTLFAVRAIRDDRGVHLALARSRDGGRAWAETSVALPGDARPVDLTVTADGRLLLSTTIGLFIGSPDGENWERAAGDLQAMGAYQLLIDQTRPDQLWAATPLGVYRRGNAGTWEPANEGLPPNGRVQALYASPSFPGTWLIAMGWSAADGLLPPSMLYTVDGGQSWTAATGLPSARVNGFAGDPSQPNRVYAATYQGVCWSDDGGRTWSGCGLTDRMVQQIATGPTGTIYAGTYGEGLYLSRDGGETWSQAGFADHNIEALVLRADGLYIAVQGTSSGLYRTQDDGANWQMLALPGEPGALPTQLVGNDQTLYAIGADGAIWLSRDGGLSWTPAQGLPANAAFDRLWIDPRQPARVLAARRDAGLWISEDDGRTWRRIGQTLGDNKVLAIAADHSTAAELLIATATAGIWISGRAGQPSPPPEAVDARIEIVWPHDWAPVAQATRANLSLRLFYPNSLEPVPCGWNPTVEVWEARDSDPARPLAIARRRPIGDAQSSLWDVNDIDVSYAQQPEAKLYYLVRVPDVQTRTSVWAHAADPRTYYPQPAWPTSVAITMPEEIDARILVVWPHDRQGYPQPVAEADLVNVRVALYWPGTNQSIPPQPDLRVRLMGSLNNGIGRVIGIGHMRIASDGITYPVWDFDNIDVRAARDPQAHWAFWVEVEGYTTYSNIWMHGIDARTYFPIADQPIVGCRP